MLTLAFLEWGAVTLTEMFVDQIEAITAEFRSEADSRRLTLEFTEPTVVDVACEEQRESEWVHVPVQISWDRQRALYRRRKQLADEGTSPWRRLVITSSAGGRGWIADFELSV